MDNHKIGSFKLDIEGVWSEYNIHEPSGVYPRVEIVFDIDANGILTVTARNNIEDKQQKITISSDKINLSDA